ncbi:hypothetical protein M409DRAFT_53279 [Zasmidium cellare ATCC 36951]|uniref:Uncharacterized protein n=1 Tax=Zasmidium cellare ATCC 36951 TaxID=1080233 RepID=A0A6A6CS98_ZASCE|nr:uncharacterized protein M409DRAFT_53279 [Zasmidium cellare ATCC 36951]KAF2168639.1 hypothetical protein M409DRAFT_53279 [Zasmidium cellare ATCC 36951]
MSLPLPACLLPASFLPYHPTHLLHMLLRDPAGASLSSLFPVARHSSQTMAVTSRPPHADRSASPPLPSRLRHPALSAATEPILDGNNRHPHRSAHRSEETTGQVTAITGSGDVEEKSLLKRWMNIDLS